VPRPRRWGLSLVAAVVAAVVLGSASPAAAHAELIDTDPAQGAVLPSMPDVVRFTFNEHVTSVPDGVQVFDAQGDSISSSAMTRDDDLLVTIDEKITHGTVLVAWRVVSADGHPIGGTLSFSIGAPSPVVETPASAGSSDDVPIALSLSRWPAYAGLLLAVGLVWFLTLLLPQGLDPIERVWLRLRTTARVSGAIAAVAWLVGLPLTALYVRGTGMSTINEALTWQALPTREVVLALAVVVALVAALLLLPASPDDSVRHLLAAVAGLLALAPLPLSGHTMAEADTELAVVVDLLHLVAGATWFGGLVGLAVTLPTLAGRSVATAAVVESFSTAAASVLAALVLTGSFLAWRIVGSWSALVHSGYGQLLLSKIAVVAVAVGLASYNRFRLLPRIREAAGFVDRSATARALARTARLEALTLVGVLLVTGFLVQKSPPSSATPSASAAQVKSTDLGDLTAGVTLAPATTGHNTVTVRIRNSVGSPAEILTPPRVRVASDDLDLGDIPLEAVGVGTYEGTVVIPRPGTWRVQVSLRIDKFTNPVGSVEFAVTSHDAHG
jgi:copper transport protein